MAAIPSVASSASFGISGDAAGREGDRPSQPEEDFEFAFPTGCATDEPIVTADELFSHGRVLPIYPVFDRSLVLHWPDEQAANGPERQVSDRQLLIEERRTSLGSISSSSFDTDDLQASVAVRKDCPWTTRSAPQSPNRRRESASAETGRRWRLHDVLFGSRIGRNQSDSQKKSLFVEFPSYPPSERIPSPSPKPRRNRKAATGLWRFFLPYRPELFGRVKAQKRHFH